MQYRVGSTAFVKYLVLAAYLSTITLALLLFNSFGKGDSSVRDANKSILPSLAQEIVSIVFMSIL